MAGSATTELQVLVKTPGVEKLPQLSNSLRRLTVSTKEAGLSFTKLSAGLKKQQVEGGKSINNTRALSNAWKELAASVEFGSKQFEVATARAKRLDASLMKMQGTSKGAGGLGRTARTGGAIAAGAVFGGPEGAIGAAIGGIMGGPIAAGAGAAYGATVGMARKSIASTAEYSAALGLQRKALKLVIADTNTYAKAQAFLELKSQKLAIPQDVIVRQFTALTASVKGAGRSVEDAEKVFESIASGIRGTGGSLEDMKAAMTATSQVFSKGKVSAEELRQQLGERLPGAFTIFAESMGKTPAELDKALEGGKVTLDDFMKFAETLFKKYGKNAEVLAAGPEAAGDRLATAMSELKDNIGKLLTPIGANFQDTFTDIIKAINPAIEKLVEFQRTLRIASMESEIQRLEEVLESGRIRLNSMSKRTVDVNRNFDIKQGPLKTPLMLIREELELKKQILENTKNNTEATSATSTAQTNVNKTIGETINLTEKVGQTIRSGIVDAIEGAITGAKSLNEVLSGVLRSIGRMYLQAAVNKIPLPGLNANGNVYGSNGIVPFSKGGVVSQPTIFPYAKGGIGLMGEAGPEAIMPLKRGSDGRLGVEAKYRGGGGTTVNYTGPTLNFNGDEYVPRSAVGEIINTAAQRGASVGEARTLSSLRNSRSRRSNLGL